MPTEASGGATDLLDGTGYGSGGGSGRTLNSTLLRLLNRALPPVSLKEKGTKYDGPLSTFEEYHAVYMGIALAYAAPEVRQEVLRTMFLGYSGGRGAKRAALSDDPHVHDAVEEPAYAAFGLMVGQTMKRSGIALDALTSLS